MTSGTDYEVDYSGTDRETLERGDGSPLAIIKGINNYGGSLDSLESSVTIPLSIYQKSLSNSRVYIVYDEEEFSYTGEPVLPTVTVYYGAASDIRRAKRNKETDESLLTSDDESEDDPKPYGLTKLEEYREGEKGGDYILSYGANTVKGKTGKVIVSGIYDYAGKATSTFTIAPQNIYPIFGWD